MREYERVRKIALALPEVRQRVRRNLRAILGPRPYGQELLDVFRTFSNFASCLTEALAVAGKRAPKIDCSVSGAEYLREAIARGRGVILVTAHTGGWETAGPLLKSEFDLDVMIAMQSEPDAEARQIQDRARERSGVKVVHVGNEPLAILPLFMHVRRGGALGVQIDRSPDAKRSLPVQLFGSCSRVPSGPFLLAQATGAPILPVFTRRVGFFRYEIRLCPLLDIAKGAPPKALVAAAESAAQEMESFIRAHPTHWFDFRGAKIST